MKFLLLFFSIIVMSNISAQNRISRQSSNRIKKKINKIDINKLNLESKIVGKTALPALYRFKNKKLILNGAGLRELLWIDVYACGLYVSTPDTNPYKIVTKDEVMIIRMDILSKAVSHSKMVKAFHKGFNDGNTEAAVKKLQPEITDFLRHIRGLVLNVGDKVDVTYEPDLGVSLYVNYKKIGTVGDLDFKKAIFNIWLSNNPVDKSLKVELLDGAEEFLSKK